MTEPTESLYEKVLAAQGDAKVPAPSPARISGAVILWRRRGGSLECFWVKRSDRVRFMPGWHGFPGGAVRPADREVPFSGRPRGLDEASTAPMPETLSVGEPDLVPGLVAATLRELFEETGLLVIAEAGRVAGRRDRLEEIRSRVLQDPDCFGAELTELDVTLDGSELTFAGRWLTPPFSPVRFDNRFFLLEWPTDRPIQPRVFDGELDHGEWIEPRTARERWRHGEVLAAPPILHTLEVLAEDGPHDGLPRLLDTAEADLGPFRRIEFRPGVLLFPVATPTLPPATHTNCYVLGYDDAVLVDPGSPFEEENERLLRALRATQEELDRRLTAIWLTHHHPDHRGGVERIGEALDLPVAAHPETVRRLPSSHARPLTDGETVDLGRSFEVSCVHTPGHARGHLSFFLPEHRSLVCGDLVSALSTIVIDPPHGDMGDYLDSLRRVHQLRPRVLFPGHGPVLSNGTETLERLIEHRLWRESRVLEEFEAGATSSRELVAAVYDDVPQTLWPLAERQIEAHLEHLREQGDIDRAS